MTVSNPLETMSCLWSVLPVCSSSDSCLHLTRLQTAKKGCVSLENNNNNAADWANMRVNSECRFSCTYTVVPEVKPFSLPVKYTFSWRCRDYISGMRCQVGIKVRILLIPISFQGSRGSKMSIRSGCIDTRDTTFFFPSLHSQSTALQVSGNHQCGRLRE